MSAVLELSGIVKSFHALRPLRIESLTLQPGDHVALVGLDAPAAEVLVNVLTGAVLPEQGEVRILGEPTSSITSSDSWLAMVDRFGIVSERAVLLEPMTVVQNLAMPFSLDIEPPPPELRAQAEALAAEVGLPEADWNRRLSDLPASAKLRVRLGRALALDPTIILLEHPSVALDRAEAPAMAHAIRNILDQRRGPANGALASLTLTADRGFAEAIAGRVLTLDPASGRLAEQKRSWFGRGMRSL